MTDTQLAQPAGRDRTRSLATAALIAALLCVSSGLTIPLKPVPFTFQVFFVVLAALLLRPMWAFGAVAVYVLIGAAGVPVFAEWTGGLGVLFGPTGGYLVGFAVGAGLGSLARIALRDRVPGVAADAAAAIVAIAVTYGIGMVWLANVASMSLAQAFVVGVAPFLLFDAIKGAVAIAVAAAVRKATGRTA